MKYLLPVLCLFLIVGCEATTEQPAYTSSLTEEQALEAARFMGEARNVGTTGSMYPILHGNTVVALTDHWDGIREGDVIVFKYRGRSIIHQVYKSVSGGFWTRGTANRGWDQILVTYDMYEGTLIAIIPFRKEGE